jgi:4-hydroxybenzoate polyprenyltransferase
MTALSFPHIFSINDWLALIRAYYLAIRAFPYTRYLITTIPFIALLINYEIIPRSPSFLWLMAPFMAAMAAGFSYNTICDARGDPTWKNPITRGELRQRHAHLGLVLLLFMAILAFWFIYPRQGWILLSFSGYLLLWLAYSGLYLRLKENTAVPVVASFLLWAGSPLIITIAFPLANDVTWFLWSGILLVFAGHEFKHARFDYPDDANVGWRTIVVRLNRLSAAWIEYIFVATGYIFLLLALLSAWDRLLLFATLFALVLGGSVAFSIHRQHILGQDSLPVVLPYIAAKLFLVLFAGWTLQLSPLVIVLMAWLYLSK